MAIDTAKKRASVLQFVSPAIHVQAPPSGTIDVSERAIVCMEYAGYTYTPVISSTSQNWPNAILTHGRMMGQS